MDNEIEQILDTARRARKLAKTEKEACRKFLVYVKNMAIPNERADEERRGLPLDKPSPLEARFKAAMTDSWQLEHLLGDFWETRFCDIVSEMELYTRLLQRRKLYGTAHASRNIGLPGRKREDVQLADVEIYQLNKGLIAHVEVKHKKPFLFYPLVGIDFYDERVKLFGNSPLYYAIHSYLPFDHKKWKGQGFEKWGEYWKEHSGDYQNADKWAVDNWEKDWVAVRVTPDMELTLSSGYKCIKLEQFKSLKDVLNEMKKHAT